MDKTIEAISVLFDKIYSAFLLRDIAGKAVPGLLFILPIFFILINNDMSKLSFLSELNFAIWLLFIIMFWIIGYMAQSFGELVGLVTYSLSTTQVGESKRIYRLLFFKTYYVVPYDNFIQKHNIAYSSNDDINAANLKYLERLAVVREACGNAASALFLSMPYYVYYFYVFNIAIEIAMVCLSIILISIFLLEECMRSILIDIGYN